MEDIEILYDVQCLVSDEKFDEAIKLIDNNPRFIENYPVVKKLVSNKKEIKIRDYLINNCIIVRNKASNVEKIIIRSKKDSPSTEISKLIPEIEESIDEEIISRKELRCFLDNKTNVFSELNRELYPEKQNDLNEIGIHDSFIKNSTIILNNIKRVNNYYKTIEKSEEDASGIIESLNKLTSDIKDNVNSIKEIYSEQVQIISNTRKYITTQNYRTELDNMKKVIMEREKAINDNEEIFKTLKKRQINIEEIINRLSKYYDRPESHDIKHSKGIVFFLTVFLSIICSIMFSLLLITNHFDERIDSEIINFKSYSHAINLVIYMIIIIIIISIAATLYYKPDSIFPALILIAFSIIVLLTYILKTAAAAPIIININLLTIISLYLFPFIIIRAMLCHYIFINLKKGIVPAIFMASNINKQKPSNKIELDSLINKLIKTRSPLKQMYLASINLNIFYIIIIIDHFFNQDRWSYSGNQSNDNFWVYFILTLLGAFIFYSIWRYFNRPKLLDKMNFVDLAESYMVYVPIIIILLVLFTWSGDIFIFIAIFFIPIIFSGFSIGLLILPLTQFPLLIARKIEKEYIIH